MGYKENVVMELASAIGELPFLGSAFDPRLVLSCTAVRRRQAFPQSDVPLETYLEPDMAKRIFDSCSRSRALEPESIPLSDAEEDQIGSAVQRVLGVRPEWTSLFSIPVQNRKVLDGRISMTSALIPQVVFFGEAAFQDDEVLAEIIVHEYAHLWLNFIAEIADLQTGNATPKYRLPSGTKDKSLRGVLLAGHFAAAAHKYHSTIDLFPDRITYLADYLRDCVALIVDDPDFTTMGRWVCDRLKSYGETLAVLPSTNE